MKSFECPLPITKASSVLLNKMYTKQNIPSRLIAQEKDTVIITDLLISSTAGLLQFHSQVSEQSLEEEELCRGCPETHRLSLTHRGDVHLRLSQLLIPNTLNNVDL